MERKTFLAIALSLVVFVVYFKVVRMFYPEYGKAPQQEIGQSVQGEGRLPSLPATTTAKKGDNQVALSVPVVSPASPEEMIEKEELTSLHTAQYSVFVSEQYGSLVGVGFNEFIDPDTGEALKYMEAASGADGVGALEVWVDGDYVKASNPKTDIGPRSVGSELDVFGVKIKKVIKLSEDGYGSVIGLQITNTGDVPRKVQLRMVVGSGIVTRSTIDKQYVESNWIKGDEVLHIKGLGEGKSKQSDEVFDAVSIKNRHFSTIIKPDGKINFTPYAEGKKDRELGVYLMSEAMMLAPAETRDEQFLLYMGMNKTDDLKPFDLEQVVNFGKLDPICKLLLGMMQMIHKVARNYGLAIILLTIFINLLLTPLSKASFTSMKRMQMVQPEVTKLREKHKNAPDKLNKEMLELYRKHKVNPMGGCLPMLLQMPIFISLYVALSKSPELLGASFLWIKDLAYPDIVHIPFKLPLLGDNIHLLPLIMIVTMVIQQKISASSMPQGDPSTAQTQKFMMMFMPVFFGFICYPMPAGLVLYWLTNTIAMSAYQRFLKNRPLPETPKTLR